MHRTGVAASASYSFIDALAATDTGRCVKHAGADSDSRAWCTFRHWHCEALQCVNMAMAYPERFH